MLWASQRPFFISVCWAAMGKISLLLEALSLYVGLSAMSTTDLKGKEVNDQHSSPLQAGDIICDVYVKVYPDF